MSLIEDKKAEKKAKLLDAAYELFTTKGIENTSIFDITRKAKVAKGTFYLYFDNKYELSNYLIIQLATKLFIQAKKNLEKQKFDNIKSKIIYIVEFTLDIFNDNKDLLKFISKNLSWGIIDRTFLLGDDEEGNEIEKHVEDMILNSEYVFKDYQLMIYTIIELVNSTCHNVILYNNPVDLDTLKQYLCKDINSIIDNHIESVK